MKLSSLREILLRKSLSNQTLKSFVYHISDDHLLKYVTESLEKMAAKPGASKSTNQLITDFASDVANSSILPKMMHDHLSHHATRYASALKAGNKDLAGKHMQKIFNNLYLTQKMIHDGGINHTGGAISNDSSQTSWVDPKPWERHRYTNTGPDGKFQTALNGIKRNFNSAPYYDYLQGAPHSSYANEVHGHGHKKAWPVEEIKINGKHIHIDHNHQHKDSFEPHIFDSHPIMDYNLINTKPANINDQMISDFTDKSQNFLDTHASGSYVPMHVKNPELGSTKSAQAHPEVTPLDTSSVDEKNRAIRQSKTKTQSGSDQPPPLPKEATAQSTSSAPAKSSAAEEQITPENLSVLMRMYGEAKVNKLIGKETVDKILGRR